MELLARPAHQLLDLLDAGEADSSELFDSQVSFARAIDGELNAFLSFSSGEPTPANGLALDASVGPRRYARLPYACKDIFTTLGIETTAGSAMLRGYVP